MLSNVTHSNFNFECNKERGSIDQLYIELGHKSKKPKYFGPNVAGSNDSAVTKRMGLSKA